MKTDPKYGYYPWWPEDGDAWLHPEDVELGRSLIPSYRIFRRDGSEGPFGWLHYGEVRLRVKPTLWKEVSPEGFEIGDWVEVLSPAACRIPRERRRFGRCCGTPRRGGCGPRCRNMASRFPTSTLVRTCGIWSRPGAEPR